MTMTAADGLNFGERRALNLKSVVDPAIVLLPDGTYILLTAVSVSNSSRIGQKDCIFLLPRTALILKAKHSC